MWKPWPLFIFEPSPGLPIVSLHLPTGKMKKNRTRSVRFCPSQQRLFWLLWWDREHSEQLAVCGLVRTLNPTSMAGYIYHHQHHYCCLALIPSHSHEMLGKALCLSWGLRAPRRDENDTSIQVLPAGPLLCLLKTFSSILTYKNTTWERNQYP